MVEDKSQKSREFRVFSAIGILCVVFGHTGSGFLTVNNIFPYYSFHIALFFFISGYFFKYQEDELKFIAKRFRKLIVPFYITFAIYLIIQTILSRYFGFSIGARFSLWKLFVSPWINCQPYAFCIPGWFVFTLFEVQVVYLLLFKINKVVTNIKIADLIITIVCVCLGYLSFILKNDDSPEWLINIYKCMYTIGFYQFGIIYKRYIEPKNILRNNISILCGIIIILELGLRVIFPDDYYIGIYSMNGTYLNYFAVIAFSILGILFWKNISYLISKVISEKSWIIYLGNNTYSVMMNHLFVIFVIQGFLFVVLKIIGKQLTFDIEKYKSSIYWVYRNGETYSFIIGILAIVIILGIDYIIDKSKIKK